MGASNFLLIDLLINLQSPESLFFRTEHSSLVANTFIPKKEEKETFFWHQRKTVVTCITFVEEGKSHLIWVLLRFSVSGLTF